MLTTAHPSGCDRRAFNLALRGTTYGSGRGNLKANLSALKRD
jgi:hypothetical protein